MFDIMIILCKIQRSSCLHYFHTCFTRINQNQRILHIQPMDKTGTGSCIYKRLVTMGVSRNNLIWKSRNKIRIKHFGRGGGLNIYEKSLMNFSSYAYFSWIRSLSFHKRNKNGIHLKQIRYCKPGVLWIQCNTYIFLPI